MINPCRFALVAITAALAGCSTVHGTSFGLPRESLSAPSYEDAAGAVADLEARNLAYIKAANGAANGSQKFDIPAILAGTLGVASSGFSGVTKDMAPTAGTIAAGALGLRTYYNGGSRYGAYVGGARGTSCLLNIAMGLQRDGLSADTLRRWNTLVALAPANAGSAYYDEVTSVGPIVTSALTRLTGATLRVDTEVIRKLAAPAAPDLSTYMQSYQAALGRAETEKAAVAKGQAAALRALMVADALADAKPLLANTQLLESLAGLDARIEQCVAFAV